MTQANIFSLEQTPTESGSLLVSPGVIKGPEINARREEKRSAVAADTCGSLWELRGRLGGSDGGIEVILPEAGIA